MHLEQEKTHFTSAEVAEMFSVSKSLLRFWETEFDILQPEKNAKGERQFSEQNIAQVRLIYQLVKERGLTLEGAKRELMKFKAIEKLQNLKVFLEKMKNNLAIWWLLPFICGACSLETKNENSCVYGKDIQFLNIQQVAAQNGFLPMNAEKRWIYADTIVEDGKVIQTQVDTIFWQGVRQIDGDIWWQANQIIGTLRQKNDTIHTLENVFPNACLNARLAYFPIQNDTHEQSITVGGDFVTLLRATRVKDTIHTPAGNFGNAIRFQLVGYYTHTIVPNVGFVQFQVKNVNSQRDLTLIKIENR